MKTKCVIFDLDNTLADVRGLYEDMPTEELWDWDKFVEGIKVVKPLLNTERVYDSYFLADWVEVVIMTARPEKYRAITEQWISKNLEYFPDKLIMMEDKDFDAAEKNRFVSDVRAAHAGYKLWEMQTLEETYDIIGYFDDSVDTIQEINKHLDIPTFLVRP